jgi:Zn-dependent metalloprotease
MKKIIVFFAFAGGLICSIVSAQQGGRRNMDSLNFQMKKIESAPGRSGWFRFKEGKNIDPEILFTKYKSEFNLKENDKMVLFKSGKDKAGYTHFQFYQYYKNIRVDDGTYNVHADKDGVIYAANGKLDTGIDINIVPVLSDKQAIDIALKFVNAKEYMWESDFWERNLKERTGKNDTTYYPTPELVIRGKKDNSINANNKDQNYVLAYRVDIYSSSPYYSQRIYIDAKTGKIFEAFPLQSNDHY